MRGLCGRMVGEGERRLGMGGWAGFVLGWGRRCGGFRLDVEGWGCLSVLVGQGKTMQAS